MNDSSLIQTMKMPTRPVDETLAGDLQQGREYDFDRALYRCTICGAQGENSSHKYLDDCPYFGELE